jgi:hypothetical protein
VKHIAPVTKAHVARAGKWEDFVCIFAQTFNSALSFFGGASPLMAFVEDKCDIPNPNPNS